MKKMSAAKPVINVLTPAIPQTATIALAPPANLAAISALLPALATKTTAAPPVTAIPLNQRAKQPTPVTPAQKAPLAQIVGAKVLKKTAVRLTQHRRRLKLNATPPVQTDGTLFRIRLPRLPERSNVPNVALTNALAEAKPNTKTSTLARTATLTLR